MSNAKRDQNNVPTKIGVSNADGITIVLLKITSSTNAMQISDGTSGVDHGTVNAKRDENEVPCLMGVASMNYTDPNGNIYVQGVTPVAVYFTSDGKMLTQST